MSNNDKLTPSMELTKEGKTIAGFLQKIFIFPEEDAQATPCRIEHIIKPETAKQFRNLTDYLITNIIGKQMSKEKWDEVIQKD